MRATLAPGPENRFNGLAMRLPLWCLSVLFSYAAAAGESPRDLAVNALESQRSDEDRKLTEMTVPDGTATIGPPEGAEIYVIYGYISYRCLRIFIRDGNAVAQRVNMSRTWFYSPKEDYSAEEREIPMLEFARVWEAARLVTESSAPRRGSGKPRGEGWGSTSVRTSRGSHEPTYYVRFRDDSRVLWDSAVRGTSEADGVRDFGEVRTKALATLFEGLFPKDADKKSFPLYEWGPFLTKLLAESENEMQGAPARLDRDVELTAETCLRLLGQIGYVPAKAAISTVAEDAKKAPPKSHWAKSLAREAEYALTKISVQERFDAVEVDRMVHAYGRKLNPDRDMARWLRDQYFEQDQRGYLAMLARDMTDEDASEDVLLESVEDVHGRFPEEAKPLLAGVLDNRSTEVSVKAALALLESDPTDATALDALERAAGNPFAAIPANARWFSRFGRERALDYLASQKLPIPPGRRWDAERIDRQLGMPFEDGRMINRLISARDILAPGTLMPAQRIGAYRKAFGEPYNRGTLEACEELIKLKDKESKGRIAGILDELEAGCDQKLPLAEDPEAKYPGVGKFDVERVREQFKSLSR